MEFKYSEELKQILGERTNYITRFGISAIFFASALIISLTAFINLPVFFNASILITTKENYNNTAPIKDIKNGSVHVTEMFAIINVNAEDVGRIKPDEKVIFRNPDCEALIFKVNQTFISGGKAAVSVVMRNRDFNTLIGTIDIKKTQQIQVVESQRSVFNLIFNHVYYKLKTSKK